MAERKVALLWRGDRRKSPTEHPKWLPLRGVIEALVARGIQAEVVQYDDDGIEETRTALMRYEGVLVWVDPLSEGRNRQLLDTMLRDIAARGVWVSTHPDVILKMGVKEVLFSTRDLGWGSDVRIYRTVPEFQRGFPESLRTGPRVIKRNRGNGGQGIWRVEIAADGSVNVLEARRGSVAEDLSLPKFMSRCEEYLAADGCLVDQAFQPRLPEGMIRCYVSRDRVVGFGQQLIKALVTPPGQGPASEPGPRIMYGKSSPAFQHLRQAMETDWIPGLMSRLGVSRDQLPLIWDADFLYGPRDSVGNDTYVLCEINVSSVSPIPPEAAGELALSV